MSMTIKDGGPAFPRPVGHNGSNVAQVGMDLRDWFATFAPRPARWRMKLEADRDRARNPHNDYHKPKLRSETEIEAALRYEYADAMIAARSTDTRSQQP